jgi:hypothetical protein
VDEKTASAPIDANLWYSSLFAAVHGDVSSDVSKDGSDITTKNENGSSVHKRTFARDKMWFYRSPLLKKLLGTMLDVHNIALIIDYYQV